MSEISRIIQPYIHRFKELLPELDENIEGTQQRRKKMEYFQSFRSEESLRALNKSSLDEFFTNLWAFQFWKDKEKQLNKIFQKGPDYVKNELVNLLFGKEPVEIRFETFINNVAGVGPAITSELLCWKYPAICAIWNTPVDKSLKMLKLGDLQFKPSMIRKAENYGPFCSLAKRIMEEMKENGFPDADLSTVDYLFYSINLYGPITHNNSFSKELVLDAINIAETIVKEGLSDQRLSQTQDAIISQEKYNGIIKPLLSKFSQKYGDTPNGILNKLLEEYAQKNHLLDEFEIHKFHFVGQKVNPYVWAAITELDDLDRKPRGTFFPQLYVSIKPDGIEFGFSYGDKVKNDDPRVEIFRSNGEIKKIFKDVLKNNPHINVLERTALKSDLIVTPRFLGDDFKTWTNECFIADKLSKQNLPDDVKSQIFNTFDILLPIFKFSAYSNDNERLEKFLHDKPTNKQIFKKTNKISESFKTKKQVILYGPPGTGKTYSSVIKAHEIIFGNKDDTITYRILQDKLRKQPKSTIDLSQLTWIQAIILAFDEINKEKLQVDEIKNSKIIQDFISYKNSQYISNTIWALLQEESKLDSITVKLKNKSGREYFDKDTESNWYLTEKGKEFQQNLINDLQESPETSDSQFSFITFHQSFSYEDFVEGIRPELNHADESSIVYRVKDGIFKEICKKALKDPGNNYVLVIDEINRGNISKIFGELITLLEDNKRIGEREEIIVRLPYSNESFGVPGNVYIIGTMNSTDKSIALVDIALRRRFHFERLTVDYELIQNSDAKAFLRELNSIICALKNADYEIGHYYFMNIPVNDPGNQELKQVFSNQILPLLEEYFFNDWEALATILGRDAITIETKKKFVWDEDSGKFEEETGDYDKIHGRCLKPLDAVFESAMNNLVIKKGTPEHNP
ncbi:MAG: McrB family protein [Methanomicrobiales archaeon]